MDASAGGIDIDATDEINITTTDGVIILANGASKTATLEARGGVTNQAIIKSAGTGANAVYIQASAATGGVDVDFGTGDFVADGTGAITLAGEEASSLSS